MNLNSHQKRTLAGGLTAVLCLCALFILIPATSLAIAAYCFGLLAVIELFGSIYLIAGTTKNSYLTNAAFPLVTWTYATVSLAFSVVIVALEYFGLWTMPVKWFVFVQILWAAVLVWRLLAMRSGQEIIETVGQKVQIEVANWKMVGLEVEALKETAPETCRKDLQNVIDAVRYADPMSCPQLESLDEQIRDNVRLLEQILKERKTDEVSRVCGELCRQIKVRNSRMKLFK